MPRIRAQEARFRSRLPLPSPWPQSGDFLRVSVLSRAEGHPRRRLSRGQRESSRKPRGTLCRDTAGAHRVGAFPPGPYGPCGCFCPVPLGLLPTWPRGVVSSCWPTLGRTCE